MMVDELVLVLGQRSGLKGFEYVIVNGEIREMAPDPIYDDDGQQKYRMSRVI
jgi:spore germination protein GerM